MSSERQRYKWDDESKDDSPSEFATTTYSTTAGAFHSTWSYDRPRRRRAARRAGLMWAMAAAVGASAVVLYVLARLLHH